MFSRFLPILIYSGEIYSRTYERCYTLLTIAALGYVNEQGSFADFIRFVDCDAKGQELVEGVLRFLVRGHIPGNEMESRITLAI